MGSTTVFNRVNFFKEPKLLGRENQSYLSKLILEVPVTAQTFTSVSKIAG